MTEMPPPTAPAGWYPHPQMVSTVCYWDGEAWSDKIAPGGPGPKNQPASATEECPYCRGSMPEGATRCPRCSGERLFCRSCNMLVATTSKQKWVGAARGGMKAQVRCARCSKVLDGPRF